MIRLILTTILSLKACGMTSDKMTLNELLTKERNQYSSMYLLQISNYKGEKTATEIMIQTTSNPNKHYPEICQLNRYDLIGTEGNGKLSLTECNLNVDSLLFFEEQEYKIGSMTVHINPFVWNGCEFSFDKGLKDWNAYYDWAKKWIDIDDEKKSNVDGLQNVIHSITYPEENNGEWTISVDFGSSPKEAFIELLNLLNKNGIENLKVHSKTFTNG